MWTSASAGIQPSLDAQMSRRSDVYRISAQTGIKCYDSVHTAGSAIQSETARYKC